MRHDVYEQYSQHQHTKLQLIKPINTGIHPHVCGACVSIDPKSMGSEEISLEERLQEEERLQPQERARGNTFKCDCCPRFIKDSCECLIILLGICYYYPWCALCAKKRETAEEVTERHRAEDKKASEDAGWVRRDGVGWVKEG